MNFACCHHMCCKVDVESKWKNLLENVRRHDPNLEFERKSPPSHLKTLLSLHHALCISFLCISFLTNPETNNKGASPDAIANPFLSKIISNKEFFRAAAGRDTFYHHTSHAHRLFYNNHVTALLPHRHLHGRLNPITDLGGAAQVMWLQLAW